MKMVRGGGENRAVSTETSSSTPHKKEREQRKRSINQVKGKKEML